MQIDDDRLERLFRNFNEPIIPMASIKKWLDRFAEADRAAAIKLLECIEFHSQPKLIKETRALHAKLKERLAASGFDDKTLADVDFSREFTCKSGDVVSYIYRKANLIPVIEFKSFDGLLRQLETTADAFANRALVILDDYIGTGSQFIFQFICRNQEAPKVLSRYRRIYLVCYVLHENGLEKFKLLAEGRFQEVIQLEEEQFPDVDFSSEKESLRRVLAGLDWNNIELVYLALDRPLLSDAGSSLRAEEKSHIGLLLDKFKHDGYAGTSFLLGRHTFFYGAPNSLPEILWPLFKRIEDLTIYTDCSEKLVAELGGVVRYDMDEEPETLGR